MKGGRLLRRIFDPIDRFIAEYRGLTRMQEFVLPLAEAFGKLQQVTTWISDQRAKDRQAAAAAATDYLRLFALVTLGSTWAQIVNTAHAALETTCDKQFYEAKIATARFYMQRLLPQASSLAAAIMSGSRPIMEPDANAF